MRKSKSCVATVTNYTVRGMRSNITEYYVLTGTYDNKHATLYDG